MTTYKGEKSGLPWAVLGLVFVVMSLRWIWVVRSGVDFGWSYEPAWRIAHGQVPYGDFIQTLPILAPYLLGALMKLMGDSLWVFQINLYLSWLGAMAVGLALLDFLETSVSFRVLSIFTASSLSFPFILIGAAHSYQGTLFAGLAAYFFFRYLCRRSSWDIFAVGFFTGLAVFAKQNVGLFTGLTVGVSLLWSFASPPQTMRDCARRVLALVGGVAVVCVPLLVFLSYRVGLKEVLLEMFADASAGKGTPLAILARGLPRLVMSPATAHRRFVELAVSAGLLGCACLFFGAMLARQCHGSEQLRTTDCTNHEARGWLPIGIATYFALVIAVWAVTLLELPIVRMAMQMLHPRLVLANNWAETAAQMAYIVTASAGLACGWLILRRKADPKLIFPLLFMLGISYGSVTSSLSYFVYAAPISIPLLLHLLKRLYFPCLRRWALASAALFVTIATVFPVAPETVFCKLLPLPHSSPFAGLYADPEYQKRVVELWTNVTPEIKGHRTLWLTGGGPHSAYGGLPVLNVTSFYLDTYNSRSEQRLREAWLNNPPEFVVLEPFDRAANDTFLREDELPRWLAARYHVIWTNDRKTVTLWKMGPCLIWKP